MSLLEGLSLLEKLSIHLLVLGTVTGFDDVFFTDADNKVVDKMLLDVPEAIGTFVNEVLFSV